MSNKEFNGKEFINKYKNKEVLFKKLSSLPKLRMQSVLKLLDVKIREEFIKWNISLMEKRLKCVEKNKRDLLALTNIETLDSKTFDTIVERDLSIAVYTIKSVLNVTDGLSDFSETGNIKDLDSLRKDRRVDLCRTIWNNIWWNTDTGNLSKEEIKERRGKKLDDFHARANKVDTIKENYKEHIEMFLEHKARLHTLDVLLSKSSKTNKVAKEVIDLLSNNSFNNCYYEGEISPIGYIDHLIRRYSRNIMIKDLAVLEDLKGLHMGSGFSRKSNRGNPVYSRLPNDLLFTGNCLGALNRISKMLYKENEQEILKEQQDIDNKRLSELMDRINTLQSELDLYYSNMPVLTQTINNYGVSSKREDTMKVLSTLDKELYNIIPGSSLVLMFSRRLLTYSYIKSIETVTKGKLERLEKEAYKLNQTMLKYNNHDQPVALIAETGKLSNYKSVMNRHNKGTLDFSKIDYNFYTRICNGIKNWEISNKCVGKYQGLLELLKEHKPTK